MGTRWSAALSEALVDLCQKKKITTDDQLRAAPNPNFAKRCGR